MPSEGHQPDGPPRLPTLRPGAVSAREKEEMPDASWRPTDWRSGASARASAKAYAKKVGAPPPTNEQEAYVSPTEAEDANQGPAEGESVPSLVQFGSTGEPWHQQPGETHEAYQAFWTYVTLGATRQLIRVAHRLRKPKACVQRWSSMHHWRMRLFRYLAEEDRVRQQNYRHELADMAERHAKFARAYSAKIIQRLESTEVDEMSPRDMALWFKLTTDIERQALDADRLRRPDTKTRSMRREDAMARTWARTTTSDDPRYENGSEDF